MGGGGQRSACSPRGKVGGGVGLRRYARGAWLVRGVLHDGHRAIANNEILLLGYCVIRPARSQLRHIVGALCSNRTNHGSGLWSWKMAYSVARVFTKRETKKSAWSGRIGHAELAIDAKGKWTLNAAELSNESVEYLMNFSLQSLQDAYAGADDLTEATANFEKKLVVIQNGTMGQRTGGVDEDVRIGRKLALGALINKYGKDHEKVTGAEDADLDAIVAKNAAAFAPIIAEEMARLAEARRAKNAIAKQVGALDI